MRPRPAAALVAGRDARGGGQPRGVDDRAHVAEGQAVRADFTPRGGRRADAARLAPGARRRRRSSASWPSPRPSSRWRPTDGGTRVGDRARAAAARLGALRAAPAARRRHGARSRAPLDGPGRGCSGTRLMRWWGWGEDGHDAPLPEHALALLRDELGAGPGGRAPPGAARAGARCPSPRLRASRARRGWRRSLGEEHVRDDRAARVEHAAGRSYPDLVRLRSRRRGRARPDAVVDAGLGGQVRRGARGLCARGAWPWCRSAAARASSAAWSRCADGFAGGGVARPAPARPRRGRGPHVAHRHAARPACSGRRPSGGSAREGLTLGPLPAVVRVLDRRRLGGHALRRAGVHGYGRIDELVEGAALVAPAGELATRAVPGDGGRAGPARAGGRAPRACWA